MSAASSSIEVRFEPMGLDHIETVLGIEHSVYQHPWNRTNFLDALAAGYQMQMLLADSTVLGYFVAMKGVDEVHLLNITVAPPYRGQGWGHMMLDALDVWARGQRVQWVWLEVRVGNLRAQQVYERHGFCRMGQRKQYYPAGNGQREDAVVMSLRL